ncbi:MAG TPA: DUF2341 domain-containing protein, partial [Anaerolineales bacterium]|nr:DUF2341 domain-containing protein [Anaerolineales bacterium]
MTKRYPSTATPYGRAAIGLTLAVFMICSGVLLSRPMASRVLAQGSAPVFDNASSQSNSSTGNTLTWSHTTGSGSDRLLLVGVTLRSSSTTVSSITYNSLALAQIPSATVLSNDVRTELWYRVNPPSGAYNVVVTIGATRMMAAGAMTFSGVHQTTTFGTVATNAASSTAPSVNVSSATDELVVDVVGQRDPGSNTLTVHASQLERFQKASTSGSSANVRLGGSTETGAATTTMSWTLSPGDDWGIIAVPLKPAPPSATATPSQTPSQTPTPTATIVPGSWWHCSWGYRRKLTIDNSGQAQDLLNFPVMVKLDATRIDYAQTQGSGEDLRFVDADGTLLAHEIEKWNEAGTSYAWVKVPQIDASSSTDHIWMYYGNASVGDGQNVAAVWSQDFVGVWHLKEDPSVAGAGGIIDSTGNNNGTDQGTMNSADQVAGQIDGSLDFDGTDDWIEVVDSASLETVFTNDRVTVSVWTKNNVSPAQYDGILGHTEGDFWNDGYGLFYNSASEVRFYVDAYNTNVAYATISPTNWNHIAGVYNGTTVRMSVNGVLGTNDTYSGAITGPNGNQLIIGEMGDETATRYNINGIIDEVRIANVSRIAAWVTAEYLSLIDTYLSYAAQEPQNCPPTPTPTATDTPTPTATNTATNTPTATSTPTATPIPIKVVYYSVGVSTSPLYSGNASASSGTLTLESPAANTIGVGDEIRLGSNRYYITGRTSSTIFSIQNSAANGGTPGATDITFSSTTISIYRAFNTLTAAEANSPDANHLNTSDLVAGNFQLNWPTYNDGAMNDRVTINGWTTGANNYIRIFTPTASNQVGASQRHTGVAGSGFRMAPVSASPAAGGVIWIEEEYVRVEGIEIDGNGLTNA